MRLRHLTSAVQEALQFLVNEAPVISGIQSSYTLVQGQDTVITGAATDAEGDAITWSFEEVLGGETKIVSGAYRDDTQGSYSGAVYVYDADGTNEIKITSSDLQGGDMFAFEVESNGSKIFVGAPNDHNANGDDAGAVYIYDMDGTNEVKVTPSTATTGTKAGQKLACSANKFAVGCWSPGKVWIYDADGTNEVEITTPAVRMTLAMTDDILFLGDKDTNVIYSYSTTTGNQIASVSPSDQDTSADIDFGSVIEVYGSKLVTSTRMTDAVYVYDLDLTNELKITPTQKQSSYNYNAQRFGMEVAISSTKIAVTAGINDDGEVYLYDLDGSNEIRITAETSILNNLSNAGFARSVSLSEDKLIVGNHFYNGNAGAFFIYNLDGTYVTTITASDTAANDMFGLDVEAITAFDPSALAGTTVAQSGNVFTISHGLQDANFTLRFKATDSAGNVTSHDATFAFSYTNQAPTVTGISSAYTMVQGQDIVITASASDPEGDAVTWSFEQDMSPGAAEYLALGASPETGGGGSVNLYDVNNLSAAPIKLSLPSGQPEGDHVFPDRSIIAHNGRFVAATNDLFEGSGYTSRVHVWDLNNPSADAVTLISPHGSGSYFGESMAMTSDKLFVGTWQSFDVAVYDLNNLSAAPTFISCPDAHDFKFGIALACNSTHLFIGHEHGRYDLNDNMTETGKVHVYDLSTLSKVATLYGDNDEYADSFGLRIVANDTHVVVGSHGDDTSSGTSAQTGAVYVFDATDLSASGTKLTPAGGYDDQFGRYFSLSNTHLAVGESGRSSHASNGGAIHIYDLSDLSAAPTMYYGDAGQYVNRGILINDNDRIAIRKPISGTIRYKLEVYSLSNLSTPLTTIESGITQNRDKFGIANAVISEMPTAIASQGVTVSQADNVFTVSHGTQDAEFTLKFIATDINGNASEAHSADFSFSYTNQAPVISGIQSVYTLTQGQDTVITAGATDPEGDAVTWSYEEVLSASGSSYVVVGAYNDNSGAGSVYVYDPSDLSAAPTKLSPAELEAGDSFGNAVAMNSQYLFVGADGDDDISTSSGAVYAYDVSDFSAAPIKLTSPEDSGNYDQFGDDIFAFGNTLVVGAYRQTSNGARSGSVFVYDTTDLSAAPTKLTEATGETGDSFGRGLAVTETQIIVSASEDNENGTNSGSVFVYDKNDLSAAPTKLTPPDAIERHWFGESVAATSSKIIVGAFRDDSAATEAGAAYVYDASNLSAAPTKLTPPGAADWDNFGGTVAVKEDCLVVSMIQDDDNGAASGSIFVYDLTDLSAAPTKITAYDGSASDMFGSRVSISSDRIYVSVYDDEVASNTGSVYVYDRSDLSAQPSKITAFDAAASDFFGQGLLAFEPTPVSGLAGSTVAQSGNVFTVTPGQQDANFTLKFKATDVNGNETTKNAVFAFTYVNQAPTISGVASAYTLTQGQDTVITATATDPEGDAVTFSFEVPTTASEDDYTITGLYSNTLVEASNGLSLTISNGNSWKAYQNLPTYLQGLLTTTTINDTDSSTWTIPACTAYMVRANDWNAVPTTGWTLIESGKSYLSGETNIDVYSKTFAAGSYEFSNNSAMYLFDGEIIAEQINVALDATSTASTHISDRPPSLAHDGIIGISDTDGSTISNLNAWVTTGEGVGAWMQLDWSTPQTVNKIKLYDRPNVTHDHIKGGTLTFSDGSSVTVGELPDGVVNGAPDPLEVTFDAKTITWVRFTVDSFTGHNAGLTEFEVFSLSTSVNGTTVSQADNVFTITPGTQSTDFDLSITATDSNNNASTVTSDISFTYINQHPVVSGISSAYTLVKDQDTVITGVATDPEGDAITWSYDIGGEIAASDFTLTGMYNNNLATSANGLSLTISSGTPWQSYQNLPTYLTGLLCTTGINEGDSLSFTIPACTVYMLRVPTWQSVDTAGWTEVESGQSYLTGYGGMTVYSKEFSAGTYNFDNNSAMYMFAGETIDMTVSQAGNVFTLTPGTTDISTQVTFTATDTAGNATSVTSDITFEANAAAPTISGVGANYTLTEGQDTVISVVTDDADGDTVTLTYAVTAGDLAGTTISRIGDEFTVTPGSQDTTFQLTFTADDSLGKTETAVADFTYDYNSAPVISGIGASYTLVTGEPTTITGSATDAEGQAITWSYIVTSGALAGSTVSQADNVFTVTPGSEDATFQLTFTATDAGGKSTSSASDFTHTYAAPAQQGVPVVIENSSKVALLLDASSTANDTIVDSSSNAHAITVNGDVSQSSFSPYRSGGYSWQFNGQGHYITKENSNDAPEFNFVDEDFTVEFWMNLNGSNHSNNPVIMGGQQGWYVQLKNTDSRITFYDNVVEHHADVTLDNSEWYHVAVSRSGSTLKTFLNGTQVYSGSSANGRLYGSDFIIASYSTATQLAYNGFLSDIRVVKGTALYTESFTPPTERLTEVAGTSLLTCNKPYLQSGLTITGDVPMVAKGPYDYVGYSESLHGGSYVFDGSSRLTLSSQMHVSGEFAIEAWVHLDDNYSDPFVCGTLDGNNIQILRIHGGYPYFTHRDYQSFSNLTAGTLDDGGLKGNTLLQSGQWYHLALTRDANNTLRIFVNGQLDAAATWSHGFNFNTIGALTSGIGHMQGRMADFKVTTGGAVYTTDFTPPTAPLSADETTVVSNAVLSTTDVKSSYPPVITNDGLTVSASTSVDQWTHGRATLSFTSGKYYWEATPDGNGMIGLELDTADGDRATFNDGQHVLAARDGKIWKDEIQVVSGQTDWTDGDVVGIAVDGDTGLVQFYINGVAGMSHNTGWGSDKVKIPAYGVYKNSSHDWSWTFNFGANEFTHTPPAGYQALTDSTTYTPEILLSGNNASIRDESQSVESITVSGETTTASGSPYDSYSETSMSFDGNGDYLTVGDANLLDITSATQSFTVEAWVNPASRSVGGAGYRFSSIVSKGVVYVSFGITDTGALQFYTYNGGFNYITSTAGDIALNEWQHVAVVCDSGSITLYKNGTSIATGSLVVPTGGTNVVPKIGAADPAYASDFFDGKMSDLRIMDGTATAPTAAPTERLTAVTGTSLLISGNGGITDTSSSANTLTSYGDVTTSGGSPFSTASIGKSILFDGNGDYIDVPASSEFDLADGDFTMETWFKTTATSTDTYYRRMLMLDGPTGNNSSNIQIAFTADGKVNAWTTDGQIDILSSAGFNDGNWHHTAITRSGTTLTLWVDGSSAGTVTTSQTFSPNSGSPRPRVGNYSGSGGQGDWDGSLADIRITKGLARYTDTFTPPSKSMGDYEEAAATSEESSTDTTTSMSAVSIDASSDVTFMLDPSPTATGSIIDGSDNAHAVTANGNVSQSSYSPYRSGGYSYYFDGTGDTLTVDDPFSFGTSDFTVEFWYNPSVQYSSSSGARLLGGEAPGTGATWGVAFTNYNGTNGMLFSVGTYYYNTGGRYVDGYWGTKGQWDHIVWQRNSGTIECYINGISQTLTTMQQNFTWSDSIDIAHTKNLTIGSTGTGDYFTGYIKELKITNGSALYTSGIFTVPTEAISVGSSNFLGLHLPYLKDSSTNNHSITVAGNVYADASGPYDYAGYSEAKHGGSYVFDGNGDSLTIASDSSLYLDGDFTIEFWINNQTIAIDTQHPSPVTFAGNLGQIYTNSSNNFYGLYYDTGDIVTTGNNTAKTGMWQHVAFTRSGSTCYAFVDGVLKNTATSSQAFSSSTGTFRIGSYNGTGGDVNGNMSDIRIVKGTAVYTADFTPPTAPLEAVTGTSLLLAGNNASIRDESQSTRSMTVYGNTTLSDETPTYVVDTSSTSYGIEFDGSSDYLRADAALSSFTSSTQPFTIEKYVKFNSTPSASTFITSLNATSDGYNNLLIGNTGTSWRFCVGGVNNDFGTISTGVWYHLAIVYDGGSNVKLYVDGVLKKDLSWGRPALNTNVLLIGADADSGNAGSLGNWFNGVVKDYHISSSAVYTSNFTPAAPTVTADTEFYLSSSVNAIQDSSSNAHTVNVYGNTTVVAAGDVTYIGKSIDFDGSGDYIRADEALSSFTSGTQPFTIEMYVKADSTSGEIFFFGLNSKASGYNNLIFGFANGTWRFHVNNSSTDTGSISSGTWYHTAIVYDGATTIKCYINGTELTSRTWHQPILSESTFTVGGEADAADAGSMGNWLNGKVSNLRISKFARYTGNFTAPSNPMGDYEEEATRTISYNNDGLIWYLDASDSNSYSGTGTTWNDISGFDFHADINGATYNSDGYFEFNGSNNSVTLTSNTVVPQVSENDYTMIVWANPDQMSEEDMISTQIGSSGDILFMLYQNNLKGHSWNGSGPNALNSTTPAPVVGEWQMFTQRVQWDGTLDMFINDQAAGSLAIGSAPTSGRDRIAVGERFAGYGYFDGKISTVQIYNRALTDDEIIAAYNAYNTSSTTPPTKPADVVSGGGEQEAVNSAPVITGIESSYTLPTGVATTITAVATDADGDAITWSYAVTSGSLGDTTVSQADNVFTVTTGNLSATFELTFIATDANGAVTSFSSDFTHSYSIYPIPMDGLFSMVDAAGPNITTEMETLMGMTSYSGSGDAWYDISGNGNDWILRNPNWNSSSGRFEHGEERVCIGPDMTSIADSDHTMIWIYVTSDQKAHLIARNFQVENYGPHNSWAFEPKIERWYLDKVDEGVPGDQTWGQVYPKIMDGTIHMLETINHLDSHFSPQTSNPDLASLYPGKRLQWNLDNPGDSWEMSNGGFYGFMIYSRKLTDAERSQIFDYWKERLPSIGS